MKTIELPAQFSYFIELDNRRKLNRILHLHRRLTPNLVATSTGCSFKQAFQILWLLFESYVANVFLLVYLREDPDVFVHRRDILTGFPKFPLKYNYGEREIASEEEVLYAFEFVLTTVVQIDDAYESSSSE